MTTLHEHGPTTGGSRHRTLRLLAMAACAVLVTASASVTAAAAPSATTTVGSWGPGVNAGGPGFTNQNLLVRVCVPGTTGASTWHPSSSGTLTDTAASTLRLLDEVHHTAMSTYWQPPPGQSDEQALDGLRAVLDRVSAVHVFSWWPDLHRLPLGARESLWRRVIDLLPPVDLLLEFVPGDDPGVLTGEARTLRSWVNGACRERARYRRV